jgi:hypothetical protein
MARYFFDIDDNGKNVADTEGVDCRDLAAAKREAIQTLLEIANDDLPDGDHYSLAIKVRDQSGRFVVDTALNFNVLDEE